MLWAVPRPPRPPRTSTDKKQSLWVLGGTLVACLRPSEPPPHRKTRASDGSRVFAALAWSHSIHLSNVNHSNSRPASFLKSGSDVVFTPGGTPALTVPHTILPWADLDIRLLVPSSVGHSLLFLSPMQQQQQDARTL